MAREEYWTPDMIEEFVETHAQPQYHVVWCGRPVVGPTKESVIQQIQELLELGAFGDR